MKEDFPSTPFVTPEFLDKVVNISNKLGLNPDDLMAVMAFESWFNPSEKNGAGVQERDLYNLWRKLQ